MITIQDILPYKKEQDSINLWEIKNPLFIQGKTGVGKSTLARIIFEKKNITINTINSNFIKKGKNTITYIQDTLGKKSILSMFSNKTLNGLIIDDLEVIDSQDTIINQIYLIIKNNVHSVSPIIVVCNDMFISTKIKKIRQLCHIVTIPQPSIYKMVKNCNNILSDSVITKCAQKSGGDWSYFNKLLSICKVQDNVADVDNKKISYNITDLFNILINKKYNLNELFIHCSSSHNLLTLMIFTNLPNYIKDPKSLNVVYQNIQMFDIIEKNMDIDWSFIEHSIFHGCIVPLREVSDIDLTNKEIKYTNVFSISTTQINKRKLLHKINKYVGKSVNIVSALLYHCLTNDIAYKKCKELNLSKFTLNELKEIITGYYKPYKFTVGKSKILSSLIT